MPKKGNACLDGTVHVGKEVQTSNWNRTCGKTFPRPQHPSTEKVLKIQLEIS